MTEFENSNIMRRRKELSEDIENISFMRLDNGNVVGGSDRVLFEPDFLVVVGSTKQVKVPSGFEDGRAKCECFYGGEKMECTARRRTCTPDTLKDVEDKYFGIDEKSGVKIADRDLYTDCPIRKLAQIVTNAYWRGKAEGQK